jgi:hypothetical protein
MPISKEEAIALRQARLAERAKEQAEAEAKLKRAREEAIAAEQRRLELEAKARRGAPPPKPKLRPVEFVRLRADLVSDQHDPFANYPRGHDPEDICRLWGGLGKDGWYDGGEDK